jgi:hypothetical protein
MHDSEINSPRPDRDAVTYSEIPSQTEKVGSHVRHVVGFSVQPMFESGEASANSCHCAASIRSDDRVGVVQHKPGIPSSTSADAKIGHDMEEGAPYVTYTT